MKNIQTANQLSGRAVGALFLTLFGTLWLTLALYALGQLHAAVIAGILAGLAVLILSVLSLFRAAKRWPRVADDPAMRRTFKRVNAAQWIAVAIVVFALAKLHLDVYVMNAITAIVGLHMFPLARLFRYRPHYATGAALVAWAAASAFVAPVGDMQGADALGTGVILWLSASVTLASALHAAAQPVGELTQLAE